MTVTEYIKKIAEGAIQKANKIKDCSHKFKHHGYGYKCEFCEYYSGQDHELNAMIHIEGIGSCDIE